AGWHPSPAASREIARLQPRPAARAAGCRKSAAKFPATSSTASAITGNEQLKAAQNSDPRHASGRAQLLRGPPPRRIPCRPSGARLRPIDSRHCPASRRPSREARMADGTRSVALEAEAAAAEAAREAKAEVVERAVTVESARTLPRAAKARRPGKRAGWAEFTV